MAFVILHGGVQKNFVHIFLEDENSLIVEVGVWFALLFLLRRRGRSGRLRVRGGLGSWRLWSLRPALRPQRRDHLRPGPDHEQEKNQKPGSAIPQVRNIPSWHTH